MSTFNQPGLYTKQLSAAEKQFFKSTQAKMDDIKKASEVTDTKKKESKDVKAKEIDKNALVQLGQLMMGGPQPFQPPGAINVGQAPQAQGQFAPGFAPDSNALRVLSHMLGGQ